MVDELKTEMQVLIAEGWDETRIQTDTDLIEFFQVLPNEFQEPKYKALHQCAFDELGYEGKNAAYLLLRDLQRRQARGEIGTPE